MRRANKILMATVAVLLCLVLISTSIVSGVFARFAITKKAETTVKLERFGVEIKLSSVQLASYEDKAKAIKKGDSVSMTFSGVQLAQGEGFDEALHVEVTGEPSVNVALKITCQFEYEEDDYKIPASMAASINKDTYFMPLGFTIKKPNGTLTDICYPWHNKDSNGIEDAIIRNTANALFGKKYKTGDKAPTENDNSCHSESYYAGNEITGMVNDFYLGFFWPDNYEKTSDPELTAAEVDAAATYLSEKDELSDIKFTYTFSIVQVS